jgi:uncharacterized protein (DUF433 family)
MACCSGHFFVMSALATVEIGSLIARTPNVLGGKPCIKGHRVGVHRVAGWWKLGLAIEESGERLPTLTPAELHALLTTICTEREAAAEWA